MPLAFSTVLMLFGAGAAAQAATAVPASANLRNLLLGRFDNREQVAKTSADAAHAIPHVIVTIEATAQPDWSLWRVHLEADADNAFDQTWAMQIRTEYDGTLSLIPYYQYKPTSVPSAAAFDAQGWLSLEACSMRGDFAKARFRGISDGAPCVAASTNLGPLRTLLPVGIDRNGDDLHLDLDYRSARTRIDAKRAPGAQHP
jgi:hypothetical protein